MLQKLIVARHGSYSRDDFHLNDYGVEQAERLAEALKQVCTGRTIILSSYTPRAVESAEIIAEILEVEITKDNSLSEMSFDWAAIFELVKTYADEYENIILVTHMSHTEIFPIYFCKKALDMLIAQEEAETGKAWLIDCVNRTCEIIP